LNIKQRKLKKDLQLQLRKILMEKRNLFFPLLENEIEFIENKDVWVTPSLPLIVFLFIGYIINILYGDI
jgi:prepilin signal peptidase PulO-like enzyme (type II secretory pathway)